MLDIGMPELLIVALIAIIVIGPKDLPRALRTVMQGVKKARNIAREFQSGVDEMVREADLDDLKQELNKATNGDLKKTLTDAVDPGGDLAKEMDMKDVEKELDVIVKKANEETKKDVIENTNLDSASTDGPELLNATETKVSDSKTETKVSDSKTETKVSDSKTETKVSGSKTETEVSDTKSNTKADIAKDS